MTRILSNDNINKGFSTFVVEMTELRSILTRCSNRSLVLGDEVCHGTESASAVSLVAASLMHLSKCSSSFIFATHLHELSSMPEITELPNMRQYHLTISLIRSRDGTDEDEIVYNRKLEPGAGLGLYGIEVAKHLRLHADVVKTAYDIRNKYFSSKSGTSLNTSRYNTAVVMHRCRVPGCDQPATETHHIIEQSESDHTGHIGHIHKNNPENLAPLCEVHHNMVHHGVSIMGDRVALVIFGYRNGTLNCEERPYLASLYRKTLPEIPRRLVMKSSENM